MTVPVYVFNDWIWAALDPVLIAIALVMGWKSDQFVKVILVSLMAFAVSVLVSWGVTAVGIHERSGREKIFTNKVARTHRRPHPLPLRRGLTPRTDIMNDEMQRKYIQSIKRVITFLQKKYPNDPSKNMG